MDREELTRRLLEDNPERRPGGLWGKLQPERIAMPQELNAKLNLQIARAREIDQEASTNGRAPELSMRIVLSGIAALVMIALVAGTLLLRNTKQETEIAFKMVRGMGHYMRAGKQTGLINGSILSAGETFSLEKNASAGIACKSGMVYFRGPGRFGFLKLKDAGAVSVYHFRILEGRVSVLSAEGGEKVVWHTKNAVYRMLGTAARLSVTANGEKLEVLEGVFAVERGTAETIVKAGRALDGTVARKLTIIEQRNMQELKKRLEALREGRPFIDDGVVLPDEDAIREHYGVIHETILTDGRSYNGYAVRSGNLVKIHTAFGVVNLRATSVASVKPASGAR